MKRTLRAGLVLSTLLCAPGAHAARESGPSAGGIFINPVGVFLGPLPVEFDFGIASQASLNFTAARWSHLEAGGRGAGAWSLGTGFQVFPVGPLYEGIYAYPMVHWLWVNVEPTAHAENVVSPAPEGEALSLNAVAPQITFGYQFDWKVVSLRLGLGGYYIVPMETDQMPAPDLTGLEGLNLALDISFGVTL